MKFAQPLLLSIALSTVTGIAPAMQWEALPERAPAPADNPTTTEKVELGKMLYHDPRISSTGTVACASCHSVMEGGDDHRSVSMGVHGQTGGRNAPTVWNAAFQSTQFWDGRAASLEDQAKGPVTNPIEMGMKNWDDTVGRLKAIPGYKEPFVRVFGPKDPITSDNVAKAIAAYERTLITPDSPYDRYVKGDKTALNPEQVRGMQAFEKNGCVACHSGPAFNGAGRLATGQGFFMKFPTFTDNEYVSKYKITADKGRFENTKQQGDEHLWRVPTLRNLAYTAPYFHNGAVKSLDEAVRVMAKTQLNKDLSKGEVHDITAFLDSLNGKFPEQAMPHLPATPGHLLD